MFHFILVDGGETSVCGMAFHKLVLLTKTLQSQQFQVLGSS